LIFTGTGMYSLKGLSKIVTATFKQLFQQIPSIINIMLTLFISWC